MAIPNGWSSIRTQQKSGYNEAALSDSTLISGIQGAPAAPCFSGVTGSVAQDRPKPELRYNQPSDLWLGGFFILPGF